MMSLALCVGVAFLLLAGSAFAGTTALIAGSTVNAVALQSGKGVVPAVVYTIPAAGTFSNAYTRTMGVARQVASGDFFMDVNLQNGFTFNATRLPAIGDVALTTAGGGAIGVITVFSGGTAGANTVRFRIPVTTSFATAPVFTLTTAGWTVNDPTGYLSGTASVTTQIEIKTYDANTGADLDNGGVNAANFITAVNALGATITSTTAVVDSSASSGRLKLVGTAPDNTGGVVGVNAYNSQDNGAAIKIMIGDQTATNAVHNNAGANYTIAAADAINLIVTGNLSGVKYIYYNFLTANGVAPEVRKTVTAAEVTAGVTTLAIPGSNATIAGLSNGSVTTGLTIEVDGTTQLTKRNFTVEVTATCFFNALNNRTGANDLVAAGTALSTWDINGAVLLFNWTSANTASWKSRMYIFNETTAAAQVICKLFQIPISSNSTAPIQIGLPVTLSKLIGATSGMTIRLEDVISAGAFATTDLAGPDNSYNIAVEITVYTGAPTGSLTANAVTGYGQTFNAVGPPSFSFGTSPLSKVQ